jgi:hypothetical protein
MSFVVTQQESLAKTVLVGAVSDSRPKRFAPGTGTSAGAVGSYRPTRSAHTVATG